MKVTLLKGRLASIGGLEKTTLRLAEHFVKRGAQVTILTTGEIPPSPPGVRIISLGKSLKPTFRHLLAFDQAATAWLKKNPSPIVFGMEKNSSQTHYRAGGGVHAAFLKQRALSDSFFKQLTFPFNPQHRVILSLEKKCFEQARTIFTNSEMVKQEILSYYSTPPDRISVVHNGGPLTEWKEAFLKTFETKREGPFRFLFIGQGFRRKGLHFLLQALTLIKEDFHLDVVGKDKEMSHFSTLCKKLHLENKVTLWGPQKEILSFYQQADAIVIPSTYDPFANVTMEALAMGVFVVTSSFNGGCEVITCENGSLIEDLQDPFSLASSLMKAMQHKKTLERAEKIRETISGMDFSAQLDKIVCKTLDCND